MKYDHLNPTWEPKENAKWRAETLQKADGTHPNSAKLRQQILERCRKDFWYWARSFAYVHEPRILDDAAEELDTKVLFLPWEHQIPVVDRILACLGKRDVRVVKSRAQGASWILVLIFTWCWLFKKGFKGNIVSKDEIAVDRRGDTDSIFGKIDLLLSWLPTWMVGVKNKQWRRNYGEHYLMRMDGQTAITGFACTGDVASGGRATVFGLDEHAKHPSPADRDALAATQPITRCRIFISTPRGKTGAYYDIVHDDTIEEPVLYLSWRDNPTQNRGLYRVVHRRPVAVDEEKYGPLPPEYESHEHWSKLKDRLLERGYDLSSGKTRSPWYDQECLRPGAYPVLIDQEYDMVFGSEGAQYFSEALINRLKTCVRRPAVRGELDVNVEQLTGRWSENPEGRFKLWCELDNSRHPPMGEYIVACDICAGIGGEGSSNSAMTVFNRRTGVKVASFATPRIIPYEFAEFAVATCRWFMNYKGDPAFLIWEANGHGEEFRIRIERSDFYYYYHRKPSDSSLFARDTAKAGYWTQKKSKLLGPYREALLEGFFSDPEQESVDELREYQMEDGEPVHVGENNKEDPAGAKGAHGDRCFVAGTMILTNCGERPIEQLAPGDLVWTRRGLRPVIACGKTGDEEVFRVNLSNGRSLIGTANHPVWTENRAWVPLLSLTRSDILLGWNNRHPRSEDRPCQPTEAECTSAIQEQKRLCSTAGNTIALPTQSERVTGGISGGDGSAAMDRRSHYMLQSGSFITDLFQRAASSITRTSTRTTTTYPTSNVSRIQNTASSIKSELSTKVANRRGSTAILAINAGSSTCLGSRRGQGFAARRAQRSICARATRFSEADRNDTLANGVAKITSLGGRQKPGSVVAYAARSITTLSVLPVGGKHSVYNLSVADTPEYFAQGVLVHNCIANALAWHASMTFGDQQSSYGPGKKINVNNVQERLVPESSAAFRRARFLNLMRKQEKSTW